MEQIKTKTLKDVGIKTVLAYIVGALMVGFIIITGVESIKLGFVIVGILFFALAVLVVIPHHRLRVTLPLKFIIIVILYVILAAVMGRGGSTTKEQKYENFTLNQKATLTFGNNNFSMMLREVKQETKIKVNDKGVEKEATTSGYFLIITGDIINLGSEPVNFPFGSLFGNDPELKDSQNKRYSLYGSSIASGQLQPSVSKEFSYFFEIPKEASGLKFVVKDKTDIIKSFDLKR